MMRRREVQRAIDLRRHMRKALDRVLDHLGERALDLLMPLLEWDIERNSSTASGTGLLDLLRSVVQTSSEPPEIFVTGHSKGGMLAPTLALYLAETQGRSETGKSHQWDPAARSMIHCVAFAGPTAGNEAFSERADKIIGER